MHSTYQQSLGQVYIFATISGSGNDGIKLKNIFCELNRRPWLRLYAVVMSCLFATESLCHLHNVR